MDLSVCRLCSKSENKLINIFNDTSDDVFLAKKILLCFGVHIREDDSITKDICKSCYFFTSTAYEHRVTSLANDAKLWKENSNRHPDTNFKLPEIRPLPKTVSYLPKDISQNDFLQVLNLSHSTNHAQNQNTTQIHDSIKKIKIKYPTLKLGDAYQHYNFDPVVALDRKDCYYNYKHVDKPNLDIWSVNNDLKNETSILLKRIKRIPKPINRDYSKSTVQALQNNARKKVIGNKIKQGSDNSSVTSTSTLDISLEVQRGVKRSPKEYKNKKSCRFHHVKGGRNKKKKGFRTKTSALSLVTRGAVKKQELKRKLGHADLKNIELEVKRRKLVIELPKVDKSELSHIYQEALKHSVNQLNETEERISSDISDHNDDLLMSFGTSQEAFICQTCNKIFDTLLLLKIHKRNSHKSSSLRCSHCSKRFTLVETLMKHLEIHSQKKTITGPNDALLQATNSKYTLRSVAKKSTGGVLDFLRSNTFSDSNLVLAVENVEPPMVNESDIEQTKVIESNSERVENSNTGETGTTEIVPAMRIVARKSTGGIRSTIRISTSSDDNSDTEGNAILTNIKTEQLDLAPPMKITARGSTEEGNSRFSVETLLLTDEHIKSPNSDPLEIVPALRIVARKSTGGVQKFHINQATLNPIEMVISSDEEDENVDVPGNVDINPNIANNQPVNKDLPWNTNESFTSNVNVFNLALQPQLPGIEEQESVENTENILVNANEKLVETTHSVQEIYDSDAEDVVFIPNASLSVNDSALNGESTSTVTTGTSTISAAQTSNQAPSSQCSAKKDKDQQNTKTDTRNKKIINETDFVNYIFNKCNYNSNTKAITNQQWILNGLKTIIDQGPVPIIVHHSSHGRLDIQYKHSPKPDKTQPIIDVPWKDITAIDFPLQPAFKTPTKVKIVGKDPNLNQNTIATSQTNQFKQTSAVQSPSDTTEFHKHVICDKSQSSTSNSGSATKQIYIRLKKTNTIPNNSPPNANEPISDPNIMTQPNSNSPVIQYPSKLGIPTSSGSNNTKTHVPTSAPPTMTKTATPPTSSQNFRPRAILNKPLPTFSSIPTVGTDVMSKATPIQQTSTSQTGSETDVHQSNGDKSNPKKKLSLSAEMHARLLSQMNKNNKKSLNPDPAPISTTSANPTNSNQQQHSGQVAYISKPNVTQTYGNQITVQSPNVLPTSKANTSRVMPANSNQQMGSVAKIPDTSQISTYHLPGSATLTSVNIQSNPKQQITGPVNQNRSHPNAMYGKQRMVNSSLVMANGRRVNILRYAGAKPITETGSQVSTNVLPVTIPTREAVSAPSQSNMNQTNSSHFTSSHLQVPTRMSLTRPALTTNYNQHNSGQLRNLNVLNAMQTYGVRHIAGVRHILTNSTNPSHLLMPRNPNQDNSGLATNPNMSKPVQVYSNQSRVANNFLPTQLLLPANMNQQMAHISESIIQSPVSTTQNTSQIVLLSQYHQQSVGVLTVRELQPAEVASMGQNKNPPLSTPSVTNIPTTDVSRIDAQSSASSDLDPEKKPAIRIKSLTEINNANTDKSRDQLHSTYAQTLTKYVTDNPNTVNETCNSNVNEYLQIS